MKTICQRCLALLTTLVLMFTWVLPVFADEGTYQVQYDVNYGQSEARTMLEMVNEFRTGSDAWYWNEENTEKVQVTGLKPLQYDYALEKVAMQRAAEIAISFSHTRPDGSECWTAYDEVGSFSSKAENIAAGRTSAAATFEQWQETDKDFNGQGHRRNMLSSSMTTFAIGHVVYQGMHFWVQEFSNKPLDTSKTQANDSLTTATVKVSASQVEQKSVSAPAALTMTLGDTEELPLADVTMTLTETWYTKPKVKAQAHWEADANGVVSVENNRLTALKAGKTTLAGMVLGEAVTLGVTVEPVSLEGATVTLEKTQFTATGEPIEPAVTVTLNGTTLVMGTDYTVSYSNNTAVGTATVTVQGTGNYTGTAQQTFAIVACAHDWGEGLVTKEPTCTEEGERTYTCSRCGETKTETIPTVAHTPKTIPGKAATCTEEGLTDGSECSVCGAVLTPQTAIPALGHDFGEWVTIDSASCTEGGSQERVCNRCGYRETQNLDPTGHSWADEPTVDQEATCTTDGSQSIHCTKCEATKDSEVIPALGHDWGEGVVTKEPACTEKGERTYTCSRCGEIMTDPIPALDHDWGEGVVTKAATCTEEGERTYTCSRCGETKTETIPTVAHTPKTIPGKAATCTEEGLTDGSECSVCGAVLTQQTVIPALGHDWGEGVVTKEATCTEEGERTYTCSRCGETKTETIPATGHHYETTWSNDATNHWHACEICGDRKDEAAHSWEWVVDQEATETQAGKRHQQCTVCGYRGQEELFLPAAVQDGETDRVYRVQMKESQPAEKVETAMAEQVESKLPANAVNRNTTFYELQLQYKENEDDWKDMDTSGSQVTVTLPYPNDTNSTDYDFIVTHYMGEDAIEQPAVTETADGLQVTFQGLSPVAVTAYQLKASEPSGTPDEPNTGSGQTQSEQQTQTNDQQATATPAPTPAPVAAANTVAAQTAAPQSAIPATGDSLPLPLLIVLFMAGACGLVALMGVKHRYNG